MNVTIDRSTGSPACVARIHGDIDIATVPDVRAAIDGAIGSGCSYVVLDLSDVPYADSSALGLLVWLDKRLAPARGRLVLAGADHNVSRILEISGLLGVAPSISTASSAGEALSALPFESEAATPLWEQCLSSPATVSVVSELRVRICSLVEPLGLSDNSLYDLKVAVGEALANAVRHGSPGGESDQIEATVSAYPDRVVVSIRDHGEGFDAGACEAPTVEDIGGRGIMFMRALTDDVEFCCGDGGGTLVRLTKRLAPEAVAASRGDGASLDG